MRINLYNLQRLTSKVIIPVSVGCGGHIACVGERNVCRVLVADTWRKETLG